MDILRIQIRNTKERKETLRYSSRHPSMLSLTDEPFAEAVNHIRCPEDRIWNHPRDHSTVWGPRVNRKEKVD